MPKWTVPLLPLTLFAMASLSACATGMHDSSTPDHRVTRPTEDTVEKCLERIRLAWNAGDAHAFASEFTEDASYVIFLGDPLLGREEIEKTHVDVFDKWQKGTHMVLKVLGARPLQNDTVSVLTIGGIGKGPNIAYDKLQTFTMVRRNGRWSCTAFQNTSMSSRSKLLYNEGTSGGS